MVEINKDIAMNVLVCGSKIEIIYIESLFNDNIKKTRKNFFHYDEYSYLYGWKFDIFKEGLSEGNLDLVYAKIKEDFKKDFLNDLIVCFIEDSFKLATDVIKYFSSKTMIYHTFIIFITTNKDITKQKINEFIYSEECQNEYDPRNVEILQYKYNDQMILFKELFKKSCYYNEMGNEMEIPSIDARTLQKKEPSNHNFNFLVIGKPGTGKSTFINIMNGNKLAKEGTGGGKVTYKICKYHIKSNGKESIILYDTPGFGTNKELDNVNKFLIEEIKKLEEIKEKFHCIIYLLSYSDTRDFDKPEEELINKLLNLRVPFYFILNRSKIPNLKRKKKKKIKDDKKDILEEQINIKFDQYKKGFGYPKVICLNLKLNDESICFGLDRLFDDLYDYYKKFKIDINSLELNKNEPKIIEEKIKYCPFFIGFSSKGEILENLIKRCQYEIFGFSTLSATVGFIPIPWSDAPFLIGIQISMIIAIAAQFGFAMEKNKAKDIVIQLTKTSTVGAAVAVGGKIIGSLVKLFPGIGSVVGGVICASTAGAGTLSLGYAAISFFKSKFGDKELFNFILNRAQSFNSVVDLFKQYSEKFKMDENLNVSDMEPKDDYIFTLHE